MQRLNNSQILGAPQWRSKGSRQNQLNLLTATGVISAIGLSPFVFGGEGNASSLILGLSSSILLILVVFRFRILNFIDRNTIILVSILYICGFLFLLLSNSQPPPSHTGISIGQPHYILDKSNNTLGLIRLLNLSTAFFLGKMVFDKIPSGLVIQMILASFDVLGLSSIFAFRFWKGSLLDAGSIQLFANRLTGPFSSSNTAGIYFGIATILSAGVILSALSGKRLLYNSSKLLSLVWGATSFLICLISLVLTASRFAIGISFLLISCLLCFALFYSKRLNNVIKISVLLFVCIALVALASFSGSHVVDRLRYIGLDAAIRFDVYNLHWSFIRYDLIHGYGFGSFNQINLAGITDKNYQSVWVVRAMHNVFLQWIEQAGLPSSICMWLTIIILIIRTVLDKKGDGRLNTYKICLLCVSALIVLQGLVDYAIENFSIELLWAFLLSFSFREIAAPKLQAPAVSTLIQDNC